MFFLSLSENQSEKLCGSALFAAGPELVEGRETIFLQPILSPPPDIIHDLKPRIVTGKGRICAGQEGRNHPNCNAFSQSPRMIKIQTANRRDHSKNKKRTDEPDPKL